MEAISAIIGVHLKVQDSFTAAPSVAPKEMRDEVEERKKVTNSLISSIREEHLDVAAQTPSQQPLPSVLGELFSDHAINAYFPIPARKNSSFVDETQYSKTWSLLAFKILQGIASRRDEFQKVGIFFTFDTVNEDNFLSIVNGLIRERDFSRDQETYRRKIDVCMKVWVEEEERAQIEVFGEPSFRFLTQIIQQPVVAETLKAAMITLPQITKYNSKKILTLDWYSIFDGNPQARAVLKPFEFILCKECKDSLDLKGSRLFRVINFKN